MFRRLAQLEANSEGFAVDETQLTYNQQQSYRYNTFLPNMVPTASAFPAPVGVTDAVRSVDPWNQTPVDVHPSIDKLFATNTMPSEIAQQQQICQAGSLDGLLASQDPNRSIRCGWAYSSPPPGSPIPAVSQGAIGVRTGPFEFAKPNGGNYQQWYWDLAEAKKKMLTDKCKALKNCTDVGSDPYAGVCGYCTQIGQGIPIDGNRNALYGDTPLTSCSPSALVTSSRDCPPPPVYGSGVQINNTCTPIGGRLPYGCMESILEQGGCTSDGALSIALSTGATPSDYMAQARTLDSMALYNRHASPQFNIDMFAQGRTTIAAALSEVQKLASSASRAPAKSALSASARDLCIKKGAITEFDFCSELSASTPPPYSLDCLQKAFLHAGGQPAGTMYPTAQNMASVYNIKPTWKAVTDYIGELVSASRGKEGFTDMLTQTRTAYRSQADALMQLRGITPDQLSNRAPLAQGVEVFWFNVRTGNLLNVTLENYFPSLSGGGLIPQTNGMSQYAMFMGLTDIRTKHDTSVQFQVTSDDGFQMALNRQIIGEVNVDVPGYFAKNFLQGPTTYSNQSCWQLSSTQPNVIHTYWNDLGGGGHTFVLNSRSCNNGVFQKMQGLTLTREIAGPILMFEGASGIYEGYWGDLRLIGMFNFSGATGVQVFHDTDSKLKTPGKNGFMRISSSGALKLNNISPYAWNSFTFVFRLNTMPVKDGLFDLGSYNPGGWFQFITVYLTPINGSTAQVNWGSNFPGSTGGAANGVTLNLNQWYMGIVTQNGGPVDATSWTFSFLPLDRAATSGLSSPMSFTVTTAAAKMNVVANPIGYINIGKPSIYSTGSAVLQVDVAWWHFFNYAIDTNTILRDANNDWLVTPTHG